MFRGQLLHQDLRVFWKFKNDHRGSTDGIASEDATDGVSTGRLIRRQKIFRTAKRANEKLSQRNSWEVKRANILCQQSVLTM